MHEMNPNRIIPYTMPHTPRAPLSELNADGTSSWNMKTKLDFTFSYYKRYYSNLLSCTVLSGAVYNL